MRAMSQAGEAQILEVRSTSPEQTMAFGQQLGVHLRSGDVVLLFAPFGAGKTHLTKGIAAAFGVAPDEVNSPSFVLVNQYDADRAHHRMPIYHVDLYRLDTPDQVATVGLDDLVSNDSLVIVEWAEHAGSWLSAEHLAIHIAVISENERALRLQAHGVRYQECIEALRASGT